MDLLAVLNPIPLLLHNSGHLPKVTTHRWSWSRHSPNRYTPRPTQGRQALSETLPRGCWVVSSWQLKLNITVALKIQLWLVRYILSKPSKGLFTLFRMSWDIEKEVENVFPHTVLTSSCIEEAFIAFLSKNAFQWYIFPLSKYFSIKELLCQ